jgi:hypothetical protein
MVTPALVILATALGQLVCGRTLLALATMVMLAPLMSVMLLQDAPTLPFLLTSAMIKAYAPTMSAIGLLVVSTPTSLALTTICARTIFATPSVVASVSQ